MSIGGEIVVSRNTIAMAITKNKTQKISQKKANKNRENKLRKKKHDNQKHET